VGKRVIQMAQEQGLHSFANSIARTRQQIVHRLKQSTVLWEDKCPCNEHSDYLREQAAKYLELAKKQENSLAKKEFLQLAETCEEVANDMDDQRVSG
jgi:hypothetical protein